MHHAWEALCRHSLLITCIVFLSTLLLVLLLRPLAGRFGLLDRPGGRKTHAAPTPVIGGVAILLGALPCALLTFQLTPSVIGFGLAGIIVIATGVIDDMKDLRWKYRLAAQTTAALVLVYIGGVSVERIGPLFGAEPNDLGMLSMPFTVIATVGIINALNMADGIDGLAGALTACALAMLTGAAVYSGNENLAHGLIVLLGAVLAFLAFNIRLPWRPRARVFLGNAGSEFLGLCIAWACFRMTQNAAHPVTPALAPFLLAPPLIDCLVVMVRRIRSGRSPFAADRGHLHHMMLDAGIPTTAVVLLISAASLAIGGFAALALLAHVRVVWLVAAFVGLTIAYYVISARRDRCLAFFGRISQLLPTRKPRDGDNAMRMGAE
ncbi:MAG: MraY family glycosyltransferase [Hyphomonadaceae bacterium]|nr:MraY family glycosyltransferase [Hyphomonadaceae bacterium]